MYNQVVENGAKYEIKNVGLYALNSIRVEQGIPSWGSEFNHLVLPQNTGLSSLVNLSKVGYVISMFFPIHYLGHSNIKDLLPRLIIPTLSTYGNLLN